ncbi:MAG: hypothetical protein JRH10_07415 [Deltaproteobacteria bacterium]|nr:hypothetical protein [Deltaproteobacteria bacterium]
MRRMLRSLALGLLLVSLAVPATAGLLAKFELFVDNVAASTRFYETLARFYETLGFTIAHFKESDAYTTMEHDGVVVALSPLPRWLPMRFLGFLRLPPIGTELVFYPESLEDAHQAFEAAGYEPGEIKLQPWGHRDFRLRDPSGYYVRVSGGGPIPEAASAP